MESSSTKKILLEVCCGNYQSAVTASESGADRVELCAGLPLGGLTPSHSDITRASELPIAVNVLIRPREGDYCYCESEVESMVRDIEFCRESGINGVVIGALTPGGEVDIPACSAMVEAAGDMSVTFHRAIDVVEDMFAVVDATIELGIDRILTSGGKVTAYDGIEQLKKLVEYAAGRISILAGSGVTAGNAAEIASVTGISEIHASCKMSVATRLEHENPLLPTGDFLAVNGQEVKAVVEQLKLEKKVM